MKRPKSLTELVERAKAHGTNEETIKKVVKEAEFTYKRLYGGTDGLSFKQRKLHKKYMWNYVSDKAHDYFMGEFYGPKRNKK